jgi:hypothetical protein
MDTETARTVLYIITGIGFVIWLVGVQFVAVSFKAERQAARQAMSEFGLDEAPSGRLLVGRAEVEGQPAALAAKAASALADSWRGPLGPLKILERADDRIAFEGVGQNATGRAMSRFVGRGQMQFVRLGPDRTAINYAVEFSGGHGLLLCAKIFNLLGLLALLVGCWLMLTFVVPNPNPAIRGQTFQMLQAVHFLWPPFLFAGLYRSVRRAVRVGFEVFVHNLPYGGR